MTLTPPRSIFRVREFNEQNLATTIAESLTSPVRRSLRGLSVALSVLCVLGCESANDDADVGPSDSGRFLVDSALDSAIDSAIDANRDLDAGPPVDATPCSLCVAAKYVDEAWLAANISDDRTLVLDVRSAQEFDGGHIPGARRVDVGQLRATVGGISGQVVDAPTAESVFRSFGLRTDSQVVVVGPSTETVSGRLAWTLEYFGHREVSVLDGGFPAWRGAVETGSDVDDSSDFSVGEVDSDRRVDADWILQRLDDANVVYLDVRTAQEFAAGHIPGAHNVNWTDQVEDGRLKSEAAILALYPPLDASNTLVVYCRSGSRASVSYWVLRHLGFEDVRLYDGSWNEWGSRSDTPKEM